MYVLIVCVCCQMCEWNSTRHQLLFAMLGRITKWLQTRNILDALPGEPVGGLFVKQAIHVLVQSMQLVVPHLTAHDTLPLPLQPSSSASLLPATSTQATAPKQPKHTLLPTLLAFAVWVRKAAASSKGSPSSFLSTISSSPPTVMAN